MSNSEMIVNNPDAAGSNAGSPIRAASDSLATGLVFMLTLAVVQRLVGFLRSILFCSVLHDDELGRWSLAFSFLQLVAPLAVVGLPGSFGRYVEHYRARGQLATFLRRTIFASLTLTTVVVAVLVWWSPFWAWLVLGDASLSSTMRLMTMALIAVIASNFINELLTAMRKVRAVAIMQFVSSVLFALLAFVLIQFTTLRENAAVIAFGVAAVVAALIVIAPLRDVQQEALAVNNQLTQRSLWAKLLPFATWIWLSNILANLFDAGDRFMIVHFAKTGAASADSLVGQYHASRVVPILLVTITSMVAVVVLPYLTHDWEAGRREVVSYRHRLTLKVTALLLMLCGILLLLGAPVLFSVVLRGKYDQGLAVLPWTLTCCVWFSLITVAQNYLYCAERARLGTLAFLVGLIVNLVLNMVLLPRLGLVGAIIATAVGNAVALALIIVFSRRSGFVLDTSVIVCLALPALLVAGPWPAAGVLAVLLLAQWRCGTLFDPTEREELLQVAFHLLGRVQRLVKRGAAASA